MRSAVSPEISEFIFAVILKRMYLTAKQNFIAIEEFWNNNKKVQNLFLRRCFQQLPYEVNTRRPAELQNKWLKVKCQLRNYTTVGEMGTSCQGKLGYNTAGGMSTALQSAMMLMLMLMVGKFFSVLYTTHIEVISQQ